MSEKPRDLEKLAQRARDIIYKKGREFYEQIQNSPRKEKFQRKIDLENLMPPLELEGALRPAAIYLVDVIEKEDCLPLAAYLAHVSRALRLYALAVRNGHRLGEEDEYIVNFLGTYNARQLFSRKVGRKAFESKATRKILDHFMKTGELKLSEEDIVRIEIEEGEDADIQYSEGWEEVQYRREDGVFGLDEEAARKANSLLEKINGVLSSPELHHTQMPSSDEFSADYLERFSRYFDNYFEIIQEQYKALRRASIDFDAGLGDE